MSTALRICLYENATAALSPLAALRPVWDLRAGGLTLAERIGALRPSAALSFHGRDALADIRSARGEADTGGGAGTVYLDGALALDAASLEEIASRSAAFRLVATDAFAGARLGDGAGAPPSGDDLPRWLEEKSRRLPALEVNGPLLMSLADLVGHLDPLVRVDAAIGAARGLDPAALEGVRRLGSEPIAIERGATIDPGTTLDARNGPITVRAGARVSFGSWVVGPASVGRDARLLGGTIGPLVGIGPLSRIRGEISESLVQGWTNKAHDGFVGHSVLGEWVNLGALTTTSDLKNNYSEIRLVSGGRTVETGLTKLGAFVGDHAKTAIGTLLTTGTVVGVGANVFGEGALSPKEVSAFAWGAGGAGGSYAIDRFLDAVRRVMARRGCALDAALEARLRSLHAASRGGD